MSNIQDKSFIFVKNSFIPEAEALISVRDRGFRFGDGVFETIRVHKGAPYQWDLHINRLKYSLNMVKIDVDLHNIHDICGQLLKKNQVTDGFLRIAISRGEGGRGYLPDVKGGATVVVETVASIPQIDEPVELFLSSYQKIPPECLPSAAKTMQGLNQTLARMEAQENQCFEALQIDSDGHICEGSSSNIFWFKDGVLYTPALDLGVLPGTIRDAIIRLSPYKVVEGEFAVVDLQSAEEVFLTNSAWIVVAVKSLRDYSWDKFTVSGHIKQLILQDMENHAA